MEILSSSSTALIGISAGKSERLWALSVSIDSDAQRRSPLEGAISSPIQGICGVPHPTPLYY